MKKFNISRPDLAIKPELESKINNLTKPKGSLGMLEELAVKVGLIQQTLSPKLTLPHNILFAADHGILDEGVSASPRQVTWQQLYHFSRGGAGINFLCNQHGFKLVLVDSGVDKDIPAEYGIIDKKVRKGTRNFLYESAMTHEEMNQCLEAGADVVKQVKASGCNIVSFGEMGSGNTSPSSMWMHLFTGIPLQQCIGAGAGLDNEGIKHKYDVLSRALANYKGDGSVEDKMAWFGGYEMMMAVGGMLQAAEEGMIIIVDGFIMTNCILAASQLYPEVLDYAIFGHQGDESGHKLVLEALGAKPLLHLGLRLGEGSGAVCAYPIIQSAVNMINEMDSFTDTNVTKYFQ
jgi:nicotinate-nucleotide--dimethylbenzimidazole phosphoribosyltransferase